MAGRIQHVEGEAADRDPVALTDALIHFGNLRRELGCDHPAAVARLQRGDALDMVQMLVRHEDVGERPARLVELGLHGSGVGRVDRRRPAGGGIVDEDAEIVAPADELSDLNHVAKASDARQPALYYGMGNGVARNGAGINAP